MTRIAGTNSSFRPRDFRIPRALRDPLILLACAALAPPARGEEAKDPAAPPGKAAADAPADPERRKQRDEEVRKALEEFKKALREAKTPAARALAVAELKKAGPDPHILPELGRLMPDADLVRSEVMSALGAYRHDAKAAQILLQAMALHAKDPVLTAKNIEALGRVGLEPAVPLLAKHLRDPHPAAVAASAVRGLGDIGTAASVEQIIGVWEELDKMKAGPRKKYAEDRLKVMEPALKSAITWLTGQTFFFPQQYREWWTQNRAAYKPKSPAPGSAPLLLPGDAGPPPPAPGVPGPAQPAAQREEGAFFRGVNLNGPAVTIGGNAWEAGHESASLRLSGHTPFVNKTAFLLPTPDKELIPLLRVGFKSEDKIAIGLKDVPEGTYRVYVYIWESTAPRMYVFRVQGLLSASTGQTGQAGRWDRVGPWTVDVKDGELRIECVGEIHLCGVEVWRLK
jgi:hypothetical protein